MVDVRTIPPNPEFSTADNLVCSNTRKKNYSTTPASSANHAKVSGNPYQSANGET